VRGLRAGARRDRRGRVYLLLFAAFVIYTVLRLVQMTVWLIRALS
jgi:hypothetical protein